MNFLKNMKFALFIGVLMLFNEKSRNVGAMLVRYSCTYSYIPVGIPGWVFFY